MGGLFSKSKQCVFCGIIKNEYQTKVLASNGDICVISDHSPASDLHFLVIPCKHVGNPKTLSKKDIELVIEMENFAVEFIKSKIGNDITEVLFGFHWPPFITVEHLHLHIIFPASKMNILYNYIFKKDTSYFLSPKQLIDYLKNLTNTD